MTIIDTISVKRLSAATGIACLMMAGGAMAQATAGLGVVFNDDDTGVRFGFERTPYAQPGMATEFDVQRIDYGDVENITAKVGVGVGMNLGDQVGHTVSGLVGLRAEHFDKGVSDEYGGYLTGRYRYEPMDAVQLGVDLSYTAIDENALFDRSGVELEAVASYQFAQGVFAEVRHLVDVDDAYGTDQTTLGARISY